MMIAIFTNKIKIFGNFLKFPDVSWSIELSIVIYGGNNIIGVDLLRVFRLLFNDFFDFLLDWGWWGRLCNLRLWLYFLLWFWFLG